MEDDPNKMSLTDALVYCVEAQPGYSASQWADRLAERASTVSSLLSRLHKVGRVARVAGKGPRGGYVYNPAPE